MTRLIAAVRRWWQRERQIICVDCAHYDQAVDQFRPFTDSWRRTLIRRDAHRLEAHPHMVDDEWQMWDRHDLTGWKA